MLHDPNPPTTPVDRAPLHDLIDRYTDAWERHDLDAIMSLHTDDTVFHLHDGSPAAEGSATVRDAFSIVLAVYPDLTATRIGVEYGDDHVVVQSVMRSSAGGAAVEVDAVDVFRIHGGLVRRKDTYVDTAALRGAP